MCTVMAGLSSWMGSVQQRFDTWARRHRDLAAFRVPSMPQGLPWPRWQWNWKWPWQDARERKEKLQEEFNRRKEQMENLCRALKAENVKDVQDVLSAMILSECVYKRPDSELLRAVNKFKVDFGEQLVPLERVQPSLEHVPHRYILAETSDTLFACFIGTKQYKDVIADANILQGVLFHEDYDSKSLQREDERVVEELKSRGSPASGMVGVKLESQSVNVNRKRSGPRPAAHRGFLGRAKGIPAVELYKLAKQKDCRLVLCGHSLGGAVAVLATLAILRVFASSTSFVSKSGKQIELKCITFSQPPVGNAALRDYVHKKGWHHHFRTYCIPEDVIPRILSPAYFQHYRTQASLLQGESVVNPAASASSLQTERLGQKASSRLKESSNEGEHLVLGLGPLQNSLWRISTLVPLVGGPRPFLRFRNAKATISKPSSGSSVEGNLETVPESLAIQEGPGTVALMSLPKTADTERPTAELEKGPRITAESNTGDWRSRVPSLPSYVPFGKLFLLEKSSVEPLSASEYTRLTSMQSVLLELRERFQSHTMRSYRARFQRVYDLCMCNDPPPVFPMEHVPHLPHLQQWLGFPGASATEFGNIAEPVILLSATSVVPLGWGGLEKEKKDSALRVYLHGYGLHLCTLVKAQINGKWCPATVESLPAASYSFDTEPPNTRQKLQKMQIRIGTPIQQIPESSSTTSMATAAEITGSERTSDSTSLNLNDIGVILGAGSSHSETLSDVTIHCSTDFTTVSKKVVVRLRRVQLFGLEGAGKTSLYYALLGQGRGTTVNIGDGVLSDADWKEGVAQGVAYIDRAGVDLQDLAGEVNRLKQELNCTNDLICKKVDLVILVHNLAHKVPRLHQSVKPALSVLMDEITSAGIPHILAITNKFSVSADRRHSAAATVVETYHVPFGLSVVVNSCPYAVGLTSADKERKSIDDGERKNFFNGMQEATQKLISAPINLVQLPFRRKEVMFPVEGVKSLQALVHTILLEHEESALAELSREHLLLELKKELSQAANRAHRHDQAISATTAASAVGAGIGLAVALLVAAASGLRKP